MQNLQHKGPQLERDMFEFKNLCYEKNSSCQKVIKVTKLKGVSVYKKRIAFVVIHKFEKKLYTVYKT